MLEQIPELTIQFYAIQKIVISDAQKDSSLVCSWMFPSGKGDNFNNCKVELK